MEEVLAVGVVPNDITCGVDAFGLSIISCCGIIEFGVGAVVQQEAMVTSASDVRSDDVASGVDAKGVCRNRCCLCDSMGARSFGDALRLSASIAESSRQQQSQHCQDDPDAFHWPCPFYMGGIACLY